jgi:hypothetical protein
MDMNSLAPDVAIASTVQLAAAGDEVAFARIVAAHRAEMVRVAYVVCGDWDIAQDAAQAALWLAWRKLPSLRDPARLRPWLMSVADGGEGGYAWLTLRTLLAQKRTALERHDAWRPGAWTSAWVAAIAAHRHVRPDQTRPTRPGRQRTAPSPLGQVGPPGHPEEEKEEQPAPCASTSPSNQPALPRPHSRRRVGGRLGRRGWPVNPGPFGPRQRPGRRLP